MKRVFVALVALVLAGAVFWVEPEPAWAEDCFVLDVDVVDMDSVRDSDYVANELSAQTQGIRVRKYISDSNELAARVRLTLTQMDTNTVVFDKYYDYQSGTFDSGVLYLPYVDNRTIPYVVTLYVEDWVYAVPFMQLQPRLHMNGGCTYGVRMEEYQQAFGGDWRMGTMIDLQALRGQGSQSIPICASNAYVVGQATVTLQQERLRVGLDFAPQANVEVHQASIYCITDVNALTGWDALYMQPVYQIGQEIDVAGQNSALLYVPLIVSYDSAGLPALGYDLYGDYELQRQLSLWQQNSIEAAQPDWSEPMPTQDDSAWPLPTQGEEPPSGEETHIWLDEFGQPLPIQP